MSSFDRWLRLSWPTFRCTTSAIVSWACRMFSNWVFQCRSIYRKPVGTSEELNCGEEKVAQLYLKWFAFYVHPTNWACPRQKVQICRAFARFPSHISLAGIWTYHWSKEFSCISETWMIKLIRKPVKNVLAFQATRCTGKQQSSVERSYLGANKLWDASPLHCIVMAHYKLNKSY